MKFIQKTDLRPIIDRYPTAVQFRFKEFQSLIRALAKSQSDIKSLEEDLKWGEPSYRSNVGSPVRFGWSEKQPDQFGIYFICTTSLVETFGRLYPDFFRFDGNRGLLFKPEEALQKEPLSNCLILALRYKKVRHLPDLGA